VVAVSFAFADDVHGLVDQAFLRIFRMNLKELAHRHISLGIVLGISSWD